METITVWMNYANVATTNHHSGTATEQQPLSIKDHKARMDHTNNHLANTQYASPPTQ